MFETLLLQSQRLPTRTIIEQTLAFEPMAAHFMLAKLYLLSRPFKSGKEHYWSGGENNNPPFSWLPLSEAQTHFNASFDLTDPLQKCSFSDFELPLGTATNCSHLLDLFCASMDTEQIDRLSITHPKAFEEYFAKNSRSAYLFTVKAIEQKNFDATEFAFFLLSRIDPRPVSKSEYSFSDPTNYMNPLLAAAARSQDPELLSAAILHVERVLDDRSPFNRYEFLEKVLKPLRENFLKPYASQLDSAPSALRAQVKAEIFSSYDWAWEIRALSAYENAFGMPSKSEALDYVSYLGHLHRYEEADYMMQRYASIPDEKTSYYSSSRPNSVSDLAFFEDALTTTNEWLNLCKKWDPQLDLIGATDSKFMKLANWYNKLFEHHSTDFKTSAEGALMEPQVIRILDWISLTHTPEQLELLSTRIAVQNIKALPNLNKGTLCMLACMRGQFDLAQKFIQMGSDWKFARKQLRDHAAGIPADKKESILSFYERQDLLESIAKSAAKKRSKIPTQEQLTPTPTLRM